MFYPPKVDDVKDIYNHFKGKFPNINDDILQRRIENGYREGEGGVIKRLCRIDEWEDILYNNSHFYTVFNSWEDYFKYGGDPHKHPGYIEPSFP